jgi:hypothetical protein
MQGFMESGKGAIATAAANFSAFSPFLPGWVSSGADLRLAETIFFGLVEPDHTLSPNSAQWGQALQLSSLAGSFRISSWFFVAARALKNRNPGAAVW